MKPEIKSDYNLISTVTKRWSTRQYDEKEISDDQLNSLFEAARCAASCFNEQPWRFIVAKRGTPTFDKILKTLVPFNQDWAKHASALSLNIVKTTFEKNGNHNSHADHDLGLALGNLTNQATANGINLHHMAGLDTEKAHSDFNLPKDFKVITAMAIGFVKPDSEFTQEQKEAEFAPQTRKELNDLLL